MTDLPVRFLTNALVCRVTIFFVVQLVVGDIHRVTVVGVAHRTVRLVGGFIHRLHQDIIYLSSLTFHYIYWTNIATFLNYNFDKVDIT